ncbi:hypothetical protein HKD37_04G011086 [Glycine soja]
MKKTTHCQQRFQKLLCIEPERIVFNFILAIDKPFSNICSSASSSTSSSRRQPLLRHGAPAHRPQLHFANMAGTGMGRGSDSQKQLLSLIRNFAAEKSQGERRVVNLRKQIEKLKSELSEANAELENAKRCKELVEQDLKGFEVQLMLTESSAQTLEARVSLIQNHISAVGSDLETLKSEEADLREQFFHNMLHMNGKIRKFQESIITCDIDSTASTDASQVTKKENDAEVAIMALESTLLEVVSQIAKEDEEYQAEQKNYENVQQQLIDCEKKRHTAHLVRSSKGDVCVLVVIWTIWILSVNFWQIWRNDIV